MRKHNPAKKRRDPEEVNEINAAYKELRALQQAENEARREAVEIELYQALKELTPPEPKRITDYHFRIHHKAIVLDIFPVNSKFHNMTVNTRGRIRRPMVSFLKLELDL